MAGLWTLPTTFAALSGEQPAGLLDANYQALASFSQYASIVGGTNTITITAPLTFGAYVTGMRFGFLAAGTNTGATTINVNGVGAVGVLYRGAALIGGQFVAGQYYEVYFDGTNFQLLGISPVTVLGPITTTGGTSVQFTTIPAWARKMTLCYASMSGSGPFNTLITLGTAAAYEIVGYASSFYETSTPVQNSSVVDIPTCITGLAGYNYRGALNFSLMSPATNIWAWEGSFAAGNATTELHNGTKQLADTLTRMRLEISFGTFDLMAISLTVE